MAVDAVAGVVSWTMSVITTLTSLPMTANMNRMTAQGMMYNRRHVSAVDGAHGTLSLLPPTEPLPAAQRLMTSDRDHAENSTASVASQARQVPKAAAGEKMPAGPSVLRMRNGRFRTYSSSALRWTM